MAAAILGDPDKFQTTSISLGESWVSLEEDRRIDVLIIGYTHTMNRDVYRGDKKTGFTFSDPYVYDGLVFEGIPEYVECMDRLDTYFDNCFGVRVCAVEGTISVDFLTDHVDDFNIRLATDYGDMYQMFVDGKCNVITVYTFDNSELFIRQKHYTGNYTRAINYFTNEPVSVVTRQGDPEFSSFVNWIMRALIAAEEQNITNVTASNFTTTAVFGEEYKNMFVNAIQAVGNYGDIYKKHLEPISPRTSSRMNLLNNGSTGLHYSYPLGQESLDAPNPIEGSKIFEITDGRGNIRCGIMERDGFGNLVVHNSTNVTKWQGMDADYCYALSASLFQGDTSKVVFVNVTSEKSGYQALDDGKVDVFAGSRITLESDVKEESTGKGFTFSMPYFYGSDDVGGDGAMHQNPKGGIAMVTREDDAQFSDFVFWTVAATIIAEEQFITQRKSGDMVEVLGFGPRYKDMHRHAIAAVGNYAEIYNRSVENIIPRQGRNLLNTNPLGPQMVSWF